MCLTTSTTKFMYLTSNFSQKSVLEKKAQLQTTFDNLKL